MNAHTPAPTNPHPDERHSPDPHADDPPLPAADEPKTRRDRAPRGGPDTLKAPVVAGRPPIAPGDPEPGAGAGMALPHERDESVGNTAARPDPVIAQAQRDLEAGLVDTDLRGTPGLDAAEQERLLRREAQG